MPGHDSVDGKKKEESRFRWVFLPLEKGLVYGRTLKIPEGTSDVEACITCMAAAWRQMMSVLRSMVTDSEACLAAGMLMVDGGSVPWSRSNCLARLVPQWPGVCSLGRRRSGWGTHFLIWLYVKYR